VSATNADALAPIFETGLLAILRGLPAASAAAVGRQLLGAGLRALEVPLNRPGALESIAALSEALGDAALIGAGTLLDPDQAAAVAEAGGRFAVMPHGDARVIAACRRAGLPCVPGVATPGEAFAALDAGAAALKLFPAQALPPRVVSAWRAVLPGDVRLIAVGGIEEPDDAPYLDAGVDAFGLGSGLFRPEMPPDEVGARARRWVETLSRARARG
jgi:2-dehydro-3-deoxyphosphogalactonate aldolase